MGKTAKRGKKDTAGNSNPANSAGVEADLDRAEAAIRSNQAKVDALHKQWKTYLVRLSYMVLVIAFHQLQSPSAACLKDVKQYNQALAESEDNNDQTALDGFQATQLVVQDCLVHLLAIIMATCLAFYLQSQQEEKTFLQKVARKQLVFADSRYMVSNACIPFLLFSFFRSQKTDDNGSPVTYSCMDEGLLQSVGLEPEERQRSLPVVLVFHVIVTACLWFMDLQQNQVMDNLKKLEKLRQDLTHAQQEATTKKKA